MKLVLTQDVKGLGSPGDLVEVRDGYGRNFLLPQGLAILATRGVEKQVVAMKRAQQSKAIRDLDHAREIKGQLESLTIVLQARAGEGGRLFGSVTSSDVTSAIKAAGGPDLDRRRVELPGHIKVAGDYNVTVSLHSDVTVALPIKVAASQS